MATLTALRESLATVVGTVTAKPAFAYLQERPTPPVSLISPANPYVVGDEGGNAFNEYRVNFRIDLIAPIGPNKTKTNSLDTMLESLLSGLASQSWLIGNVSAPYGLTAGTAEYLAVTVDVSTYNRF